METKTSLPRFHVLAASPGMIKTARDIADFVFERRVLLGWSQAELASRGSVNTSSVCMLEKHAILPGFPAVQRILEILSDDQEFVDVCLEVVINSKASIEQIDV